MADLGAVFTRDAQQKNAFDKLSRYESELDRRLSKAMQELLRLQEARRSRDASSEITAEVLKTKPIPIQRMRKNRDYERLGSPQRFMLKQ